MSGIAVLEQRSRQKVSARMARDARVHFCAARDLQPKRQEKAANLPVPCDEAREA